MSRSRRGRGVRHSRVMPLFLGILLAAACAPGTADTTTTQAPPVTTAPPTTAAETTTTAPEPATVQLALQSLDMGQSGLALAEDLGFFADENLTVEFTIGESTSTMTAGLLGGSFDFLSGGAHMVLAYAQGAPIVGVAGTLNAPVWTLVARPEFETIESLRGATFAVSEMTSPPTMLLAMALEAAGFNGDYTFITVGGTSSRFAAVIAGTHDAAPLASPLEFMAEAEGLNNLGGLAELEPYFTSALIVSSESFVEENPDVTVRFLRAYVRALQWMHDPQNEAEFVERVTRVMQLDEDAVAKAYKYWFLGDLGELLYPIDGRIELRSLQNATQSHIDAGDLDAMPDLEAFIVDEYLIQARESLD